MSEETFDAIVVGGGNKGLVVAIYLAKFGRMRVGVFERRHEAGGGWSTEETPAPGFLADLHCTSVTAGHMQMVEADFPEWKELAGPSLIAAKNAYAAVFVEDGRPLVFHGEANEADSDFELTRRSIRAFSAKDADTLPRLWEEGRKKAHLLGSYMAEWMYTPAVPAGQPDGFERMLADRALAIDPSILGKTPIQVLSEVLESPEVISMMLRRMQLGIGAAPDTPGLGWFALHMLQTPPYTLRRVCGGTHGWAHAAAKILLAHGGRVFTNSPVEKVVVEAGAATGVQLSSGQRVSARELVVTTVDPYTLCFSLVGKQHFSPETIRRVERIERRSAVVAWTTWALHERPAYRAAEACPGVQDANYVFLLSRDPTSIGRGWLRRMAGRLPDDPDWAVYSYPESDRTRAPDGKATVLTEQYVPPANLWPESRWLQFRREHAESAIALWRRFAPNMDWGNVIGCAPATPADLCRCANMAPTGNWAVIDVTAEQWGRKRPVPELARHETPVRRLFATGSAWHPLPSGAEVQAYNCYKVIAEKHGLIKPWEVAGRSL